MTRFRYIRDPLCLVACSCYLLNRLVVQRLTGGSFWHDYADDLLLIPAGLPYMLWLQRRLGLRLHDLPPTWAEILMHLVLWSVAAEVVAPHLFRHAVADVRDALAYAVGAAVAGLWWQRGFRTREP